MSYKIRTMLYGIGAGISIPLSIFAPALVDQLFDSSPALSDSRDLIIFGIFISFFLLITILFFVKETRSRTELETPETKSQKEAKILLFILLASSGAGILSIWGTITLLRPDAGQGAIALLVCIPIDCIYTATVLGILLRLFFRRIANTAAVEGSTEDNP